MTIVSKLRGPAPVPGMCECCRQRPGVSYLALTEPSATGRVQRASRLAWICEACADEARRVGPDN